MKILLEHKTTVAPTKEPVEKPTSENPAPSSTTEKPALTRDQLRRLRRQLTLENELSSAQDESENLGIEQVSPQDKECQFEQKKRNLYIPTSVYFFDIFSKRVTFQMELPTIITF